MEDNELLTLEEGISLVNDLKREYPNAGKFELIIRAYKMGYQKACNDLEFVEALDEGEKAK